MIGDTAVFHFNFSRRLAPLAVYLTVIAAVCTVAVLRTRAKQTTPVIAIARANPSESDSARPYFSLSSHRTFGTNEGARLWVDYKDVDHLDFRVYQVKDPARF